jgi:hypothetical protein
MPAVGHLGSGTPGYTLGEQVLEHDPEKWMPVFGKRSCSDNKLERDDDSKRSHHALGKQPYWSSYGTHVTMSGPIV